jgi:RNA polymerase sigma-70 factor (ECF subfamily)
VSEVSQTFGPPGSRNFQQRLAAAQAGCRSSLGEVLADYRSYLLLAADRELDDELRAKLGPSDLVQETFVRAQQAFADFRGNTEDQLRAWLHAILLNHHRTVRAGFLETGKRRLARELPLDAAGSQIDLTRPLVVDESSLSSVVAADEESQRILQMLDRLPDDYRQAVWLRNWEQQSFEEIGRRLGRSAEAARKLWYRGLAQFGRHWEQDGEQRIETSEP